MPLRGCCHRAVGRWVGVICLGAVGPIGCAATKPAVSSCQESFSQLMAKDESEYCSPILYNHFEGQVTEWRGQCGDKMVREKVKMAEKLESAQTCSEQSRRADMLSANCEFRLNMITENLSCMGEECAPAKKEMDKISSECDVPLLKGKLSSRIAKANDAVNDRMTSGDKLKSLQNLMMACDEVYDIRSKKQAISRFDRIVKRVERNKEINTIQKEGSLLEQFQKGAQASCGFALNELMKKITEVSDKEVEKISKVSRRRKRHIKRYKKYAEKLAKINAQVLFPDALEPLREVLERYGSELSMPTPKPRPVAKSDAEKESDVSPSGETAVADKDAPEEPEKKVPDREEEKKKAEAANTSLLDAFPASGQV